MQTAKPSSAASSIADLLLQDEVDKAAALVEKQPNTAETIAFRGEIEYREGNFDQAEILYNQALRMDEKTSRAHFGLGKLAMTKLKGKEAIAQMNRAIELSPREPLYLAFASEAYGIEKNYAEQQRCLREYVKLNPTNDPDRLEEATAALALFNTIGISDIAEIQAPDNPAPIPFHTALNLIFVNVMIGGKGPFHFAVDTGATQVVLSEKLVDQLGITPITTTMMHGVGGGGRVESKLYKLDEIAIGDVKVKNLPVGTFNDPMVSQLADGIMGTAILSDFIVTVDYPSSRIELTKKKTDGDNADKLPARYFSNLLLVPINVNSLTRKGIGDIKGHIGNFVVDTGAVATVLSYSMAAKLGVNQNTPNAKVDLGIMGVGGMEGSVLRVPSVTLGTTRNSELYDQMASIDLKDISKMIGTEVAGVIGFDFLDKYKLTLDYYGAEVRLAK